MTTTTFDPVAYKQTTTQQWQEAAAAWHRWGPTLEEWLGEATELMLDLARIARRLARARRRGRGRRADARRSPPRRPERLRAGDRHLAQHPRVRRQEARAAGFGNVATQVMDGESLDVEDGVRRGRDLARRPDLLPRPAASARRDAPRAA